MVTANGTTPNIAHEHCGLGPRRDLGAHSLEAAFTCRDLLAHRLLLAVTRRAMGRRSKCHQSGHGAARHGLPVWSHAVLILIGVGGFAAASDVPSPSAIRLSQREAWARFHASHVELATAIEHGVTTAVATQVSLRDIVQACATTDRSEALRDLAVSLAIELHGRNVATHTWRCDAARDDVAASRICGCVVTRLPDELHTIVPAQIADGALASYEGWLALRLDM
jgi:hypothetical protein